MKLNAQTPKQSLNKAFLKQPVNRDDITLFKTNLQILLGKINESESEEHHKNFVRDFLKDSFYKSDYEINTKGRQDLVIHVGKNAQEKVGVILEAKKPNNKADMISAENPNRKALHELVLYFLRERIDGNNIDVKYLIVTNIYEWFIFDASVFNQLFFENKPFVRHYNEWRDKQKTTIKTDLFYNEIAKPYIETIEREIPCAYFDIRNYDFAEARNAEARTSVRARVAESEDTLTDVRVSASEVEFDKKLIELFKILSPQHLLKVPFADDSNKLDKNFYTELLHIIGLEEIKDKGKLKIQRKAEARRDAGSLIENAITIIETKDSLHKVKNLESYGETRDERLFGVALELCLTWINRVLFLKLLEAQLIDYHRGNRDYRFLDIATIQDFDELFTLFHQVLAKLPEERRANIKTKYSRVPYLNSSLFEISELEAETVTIESLKDTIPLSLISTTVLKDIRNRRGELPTLEYLFTFLDAYDFASEGREGIKEHNRNLINASVLGKVFEKINGYKDGSIYTPGFITMYMCRQAIRLAVVQKFKDKYEIDIDTFEDLEVYVGRFYKTANILEFNALINSLHLCDPAVGSGHFLVSSLNEIIAVKSKLSILADENGKPFPNIEITVEADELTVFDTERNEFFKYQITDGKPNGKEAQRLQKTLFHEKQTIIENCLFGVDINPNSVKICRLRLWIELLKNAYYKESSAFTELETLPNIDINIKEGNSLVSRFALGEDLKQVLSQVKYGIEDYRNFVLQYKETRDREKKRDFETKIKQIKSDFKTQLFFFSPERRELADFENQLRASESKQFLFGESDEEKAKRFEKETKLKAGIEKKKAAIKQIEENAIYKNAFEWRFEFPEVLNDDGNFLGFDIVIGNPPYFSISSDSVLKNLPAKYETYNSSGDIYALFYELGQKILKDEGFECLIISNKWMRANYGEPLRKYIVTKSNPISIVDFGQNLLFENAVVHTNIILSSKSENLNNLAGVRFEDKKFFLYKDDFSSYIQQNQIKSINVNEGIWNIIDSKLEQLKTKVETKGTQLGEWEIEFRRGLLTGLNEAFIIDEKTKNELINKDSKNAEIIKPILRGRDTRRYFCTFNNFWIINSHNGYKDIKRVKVAEEYPLVYKHLRQFEEKASKRFDKGDHWTNLRNCAYLDEFDKPKIVFSEIVSEPQFHLDIKGYFPEATIFFISGNHLKYLTALLNSKPVTFLFKTFYMGGELVGKIRYKKDFLEKVPIPVPDEKQEKEIVNIIDQILELKKAGKDTQALENEIDTLVYRLYDLTADEIAIVEGKA